MIFFFAFLQLSYGSSSIDEIEIGKFGIRLTCGGIQRRATDCSPLCAEVGQLAAAAAEERPPNGSVSSTSSLEPPSFETGPLALSVSNPARNPEPGLLIQSNPNFDSDIIDGDLDELLDSTGPESPLVSELGSLFFVKFSSYFLKCFLIHKNITEENSNHCVVCCQPWVLM